MLSEARVAPTLAVSDMAQARGFYEGKLGLTVEAAVEGTIRYICGGGTGLALFERPMEAIDRTVAASEVDDIEQEVAELRERGVDVEGVITPSERHQTGVLQGPDGNVIGMRQL